MTASFNVHRALARRNETHTTEELLTMIRHHLLREIALLGAVSAALGLAACSRDDDRTAGQKLDSAVAKVEQKTESAGDRIAAGAQEMKQDAQQTADKVGNAVEDAAITAAVNAKLAGDSELSALKIDVDTVGGRVALKGEAPTSAAKARATQLANGVDGVASVDNQLIVKSS
jgi:hyperosmotically inducible protein